MVSLTNKKWHFHKKDSQKTAALASRLKISSILAQILVNRGIRSPEEGRNFLVPQLNGLHDPFHLKDMDRAVKRIRRAIRNREKICVYGDYDVDGVTAVVLLSDFLKILGAEVEYYIPDRISEGYGFNPEAVKTIFKRGARLVISVDTGTGSQEEVDLLNKAGVASVITDHHEPGESLPRAYAFLNPKREDDSYPFKNLSGVGVAFKLVWALAQSLSPGKKVSREFRTFLVNSLSLVALGTIADVVPLQDENRVFAKFGLSALPHSSNPGIRALLDICGLQNKKITTGDIAFRIGPRINAAGRMGDASLAVQLLTTQSYQEALEIAEKLDKENQRRQKVEQNILREIRAKILEEIDVERERIIVMEGEGWHPGVIGIVSSKIAEEFYRPTILISLEGDRGRGSARSIPGFHIFNHLCSCSSLMLHFGGHQNAAGFEMRREKIPVLKEQLRREALEVLSEEQMRPTLKIDLELPLEQLSVPSVMELERLHPFGEGNATPLLASSKLSISGTPKPVGKDQQHLSFYVRQNSTTLKAIAFGMVSALPFLERKAGNISLAYSPKINRWRDRETVELEVVDIA